MNTAGTPLLFGDNDLPRIRAACAHPRMARLWRDLLDADLADDEQFLRQELRLTNRVLHMMRARQILERSAFVFRLTGREDHLTVARLALETILAYPTWDYFLEGGRHVIGLQRAPEATIATALALEWLGESLTPEEIDRVETDIATKGAPACFRTLYGMKYPDRVSGWSFDSERDEYPHRFDLSRWPLILNATNLKVIPIAGLTLAACRLLGRHPEADSWLEMARLSARAYAIMFGTDGCFDEGVSYWGYTALHLALFCEVVKNRTGIDESGLINWPGTIRYALGMSMPTAGAPNDVVNFGDTFTLGDVSIAGWVAAKQGDPVAQYMAAHVGEPGLHYGLVWFQPEAAGTPPGEEMLDQRFSNDLVISRTGWDLEDSVLALRSGGPANHEHADRNSLLFKAYGERLLHDPFKASYNAKEPHWLLRQTEAHTAVLIDGHGHQYHDGREGVNSSKAWSRVTGYRTGPGWMIVTSDATEAYEWVIPGLSRVQRTVVFVKPEWVILLDTIDLVENPRPVQQRFQIYNADGNGSGEILTNGFAICRPRAGLVAAGTGLNPLHYRLATLDLPVEEAPPPGPKVKKDTPEAGSIRAEGHIHGVYPFVEVESVSSLHHEMVIAIRAHPAGHPASAPEITKLDDGWKISASGRSGISQIRIRRRSDGSCEVTMPESTVLT